MVEQPEVIILDDNSDISSMMQSILQFAGYKAKGCESSEQLFSLLSQSLPRVILMDMLLSGTDGREVCRALKTDSNTKDISIIMISAHPDAEATCLEAGADGFLEKPFEIDTFLKKTEYFLQSS
jgi:DNA-binding response OmpR family regulator